MDINECYRILEIDDNSDFETIKKQYKKLLLVWHPDRFGNNTELQDMANEKTRNLNAAFDILKRHFQKFEEEQNRKREEEDRRQQEMQREELRIREEVYRRATEEKQCMEEERRSKEEELRGNRFNIVRLLTNRSVQKETNIFKLDLAWDKAAMPGIMSKTHAPSEIHTLRVRLTPSSSEIKRSLPLNLAVALDTSGSMGGSKLSHAKEAIAVVSALTRQEDRFSLAVFSDVIKPLIHLTQGACNCTAFARNAISSLHAEGATQMDLALGWFENSFAYEGNGSKAAIIITDGMPTDPSGHDLKDCSHLVSHAKRLSEAGIRITAVGLGDARDFNFPFLAELAEKGKGSFIYSETPDKLKKLLIEHLKFSQSIAYENINISAKPLSDNVVLKRCCRISPNYLPLEMTNCGASQTVDAGTICSDAPNDFLFMVEIPPAKIGSRERRRQILEICCEAPETGERRLAIAEIIDTVSCSRVQQLIDPEVFKQKILWEINLHSDETLRSSDPARKTGLLKNILCNAYRIEDQKIAEQAAIQIENLRMTGKLDDRNSATITHLSRNTGRL